MSLRSRLVAVALVGAGALAAARPAAAAFPEGFRWGTAIAGFQVEMGTGAPVDAGSDWYVWSHDAANIGAGRVSGDLVEQGPGYWTEYDADHRRAARRLRSNTLRLSIEWSRVFPASTAGVDITGGITLADLMALDALADQSAVAHYRDVLASLRRRGLEPFATVVHFVLPTWIHDSIMVRDTLAGQGADDPLPAFAGPAGWLDAATVTELAKYAAYLGWKLGDLCDVWAPLNEPFVVATNGYVNVPGIIGGYFPPGGFSFTGALAAIVNEVYGHAAAYDALKAWDTVDADGDGIAASVGLVHNMVAFHPKNPASSLDQAGAAHASYIFNEVYLNASVHGDVDRDVDGIMDAGEHDPALAGKADFVGVNYYLRATAQGLGAPLTPTIPLLDFLPTITYQSPEYPTAPPCPSSCTDFGWEIYPQGLYEVLAIAGGYGLPVHVTENGLADADDDQRPAYLVRHLQAVERAITDGVADVRGYYQWSLTDNFEWSSGYFPRFGLFSYDPLTLRRKARRNAIPARLAEKFGN